MDRRTRWLGSLTLGLVLTAACGSDPFGPEDVLGYWDAVSFNGSSIPGNVDVNDGAASNTFNVEYWRWLFNADGSCEVSSRVDGANDSEDCTYVVNVVSETLTIDIGFMDVTATIDGTEMTVMFPNPGGSSNVVVLRRR